MKNWDKVKKALELLGHQEPNCLYIAGEINKDYLCFLSIDYSEVKDAEIELNKIGVIYLSKYEVLAIERENLFDNRFV